MTKNKVVIVIQDGKLKEAYVNEDLDIEIEVVNMDTKEEIPNGPLMADVLSCYLHELGEDWTKKKIIPSYAENKYRN